MNKTNNEQACREALQLSSGTMAVLTGYTNYDALEKIENEWISFIRSSGKNYANWMQSWNEFEQSRF